MHRQRRSISSPGGNLSPPLLVVAAAVFVVAGLSAAVPGAAAYKNYTVGDDKGWYDGLTHPGVDYQEWADGKNFSLGDFLSEYTYICLFHMFTEFFFFFLDFVCIMVPVIYTFFTSLYYT
jgi:hypothetical protein